MIHLVLLQISLKGCSIDDDGILLKYNNNLYEKSTKMNSLQSKSAG